MFGIPEAVNEFDSELRKKVIKEIFLTQLGVQVETEERMHRLGRKVRLRKRPVIVTFNHYRENVTIHGNCYKLNESSLSVSSNVSQDTLKKMRFKSKRAEREAGSRVKHFHDKVRVDNDTYCWWDWLNQRVKLTTYGRKGDNQ